MDKKIIVVIVAILLLLAGGYLLFKSMNPTPVVINTQQENIQEENTTTPAPENTVTPENENVTAPNNVTVKSNGNDGIDLQITAGKIYEVMYTDSGFSPSNLTVKVGDTVVWKNQSSGTMWVGSAMHPSHVVYSGTSLQEHCPDVENNDFDQCQSSDSGTSWSFIFQKKGSWGYHDHMNARNFGKITVE